MPRASHATNVALYALLCGIWGSTWLIIKIGYGGLGPFNIASVRFFAAAAVLAVLVPLLGARWPRGTEWRLVAGVGLSLFTLDYGLIYWAEQSIDSGLTAILFATLPLFTIAFAHFYVPGERITTRTLVGTVTAFLGVALLFADRVRLDPSQAVPMLVVFVATGCAAVAGVIAKRHGQALHPAALNATAMFVGASALALMSLAAGDGFALPGDLPTWGAVAYLSIVGSVISFLIYFGLMKTWSVTSLSFISVFTPAVALLMGVIFLGEVITLATVAGAGLILAGVALALTKR